MFRFEHPYFLYALSVIPVLVAGYILLHYKTRKKLAAYSEPNLLHKLMPARSSGMRVAKFTLTLLSLTALIFTVANPQAGTSIEKGKRKGVDIMVCLDVSNSMMAEDIKPNRLTAAKLALSRFVDNLKGDRIGLVAFAGKAFVQLPVTGDYAAAKMFIDRIETNVISEQGTDIANALDLAAVSMIPEGNRENGDIDKINQLTSKVIIMVSDGEDQFEEAIDMAEKVHKMDISIHAIGIGSPNGTFIPERDRNGNVSYKKDAEGNTVTTHLNEEILRNVANAGAGIYVHADNANVGFDAILEKINAMNKSDLDDVTFTRYESQFQYPLALALLFIFIETLLFGTQQRWRNFLKNLTRSWTMKIVILLITGILAVNRLQAQTEQELLHIRNGITLYEQAETARKKATGLLDKGGEIDKRNGNREMEEANKKYQAAEEQFRKSMEKTQNWDKANYNLGNALYRQGRYEEAAKAFQKAAQQSGSPLQAQSHHNLGNALLQQRQYQNSIEAYKNALKLNPKDADTRYNLEYARKMLIQQQNQQQQQQNQQQNQQNQQNQQQQQQQQQQNQQDKKDNKQNSPQNQQPDQNSKDPQKAPSPAEQRKRQEEKRQLDALQQNERRTQEKVQQQENKHGVKVRQEKDW
jgi:Ca-activated chloride channel family protein